MPKHRTKAEDIRNPEHYFNRYIAMEVKHDQAVQQVISKNECSFEEKCEHEDFQLRFADNLNNELLDEALSNSEFGWIEAIENQTLYAAVISLSDEQKRLLTLLYREQLLQTEIAQILNINQSRVSRRLDTILKKIKKFFQNGIENRI